MGESQGRGCVWGCATVVAVVVIAVALVVFVWILPSQRKSYAIDDVRIQATVRPNGTLETSERFAYTFEGDFTRVFRDVPFSPFKPVTVVGVTGPDGPLRRLPSGWTPAAGAPVAVSPRDDVTPSPWSSLAPEQRPPGYYRVTYDFSAPGGPAVRIEAFADLSDRIGDLHVPVECRRRRGALRRRRRALVATGRPRLGRAHAARARRGLAAGRRDGRGGPRLGARSAERRRAPESGRLHDVRRRRPRAEHLRRGPPAVPGPAALAGAKTTEVEVVPERLATEADLARRANEQRALARAEVAAEHRGHVIAWTVGGVVTAAALVVWFALFFSGGREYRPRRRTKYLREVPEGMPPALVGALWRMGAVTDADIAATLLDLAVDGVLRIEPGEGGSASPAGRTSGKAAATGPAPTFVLELRRDKLGKVDELTLPLVTFLFDQVAVDDKLSMDQLEDWAESHPARFRGAVEGWRSAVLREPASSGSWRRAADAGPCTRGWPPGSPQPSPGSSSSLTRTGGCSCSPPSAPGWSSPAR